MKNNEQKEIINQLTQEKEKLVNELKEGKESKNILKEKYDKLKENQDQLIMLLKLVEKEGVNLENIITKWNSQMDEEEDGEKNGNSNPNKNNETEHEEINEENSHKNQGSGEEEEEENKDDNPEEEMDNKELHSDEDLDKDGEFLPLTLGENNINTNTVKIHRANVPKLDFAGIKLFADKKQVNEKDKVKKGLNNYEKIIKKK